MCGKLQWVRGKSEENKKGGSEREGLMGFFGWKKPSGAWTKLLPAPGWAEQRSQTALRPGREIKKRLKNWGGNKGAKGKLEGRGRQK